MPVCRQWAKEGFWYPALSFHALFPGTQVLSLIPEVGWWPVSPSDPPVSLS